jgi:ParB-like chromosome segregation protein Spo0J
VSTNLIKRITGLQDGVHPIKIEKIRDFAKERGYCRPVVLSESSGCMTLLAGAATFEACLKEKETKIPAVIVKTEGEADNLIFALQSAQLDEAPCMIAVSKVIVRLIDSYEVPRRDIATALGRSPAWINRMENLSRKLNTVVQTMVTDEHLPPRSAFEIARLPDNVQAEFAVSASNEFLSKDNVTFLVNRYLNEDTDYEERQRIIRTPKLALPNEFKHHGRMGKDNSDDTRFSRAIARCMDDARFLLRILDGIDISETIILKSDVTSLSDILATLLQKILSVFYPGKKDSNLIARPSESDGGRTARPMAETTADGFELTSPLTTGNIRMKKNKALTEEQRIKFNKFWNIYPNKKSMGQAEKTFASLDPDDGLFQEILDGLDRAIKYDRRFADGYIPHPNTWLNAKGWKDEYELERRHPQNIPGKAGFTANFNQREYDDDFFDKFINNEFAKGTQMTAKGDGND